MGRQGLLLYLMGPSGSGKDSLLQYLRYWADPRVAVAHRYITRTPEAGGENHIFLYEWEYEARRAAGLFALDWSVHGYGYGIGREIDLWMERGFNVVLNGSRQAYAQAKKRYPRMRGIRVWAPEPVLRERLRERQREEQTQISYRLERIAAIGPGEALPVVDNSGSLREAGEQLRALVEVFP